MIWLGWDLWHINQCRLFNAKSSLYIYIKYVRFGWFLWHINHCRLFNAKSFLYIYIKYVRFGWFLWYINHCQILFIHIYIKYVRFGLVGFYGISTIAGYLMPNPLYTYISNM